MNTISLHPKISLESEPAMDVACIILLHSESICQMSNSSIKDKIEEEEEEEQGKERQRDERE